MGEARRKRLQAPDSEKLDRMKGSVARVAGALRRLATAASAQLGGDCVMHALIGTQLLADEGINSSVVVGFAAWRVADGDGDVVAHVPMPGMVAQPGGAPYHVWLEIDGLIVDFTTYQLKRKAKQLDLLDGGHTVVEWCPEYLLEPKSRVVSYRDVAQGRRGLFHYSQDGAIRSSVLANAVVDPEDLAAARVIFANPQVEVFGPNHAAAGEVD